MDCHDLRSRNDDKGKRRKANCKDGNGIFYGFPITTFGNDKKEENGFILLWIATKFFQNSTE